MEKPANTRSRPRRGYVAAMVLGTALAMPAAARAEPPSAAAAPRTIDAISRYCTVCWRNAHLPVSSWGDCTQEVFRRLLERLRPDGWASALQGDGEERREFLRAIDAVKKRTQRYQKRVASLPGIVPDAHDQPDRDRAEDCEAVRQKAQEVLSPRQQRILQLSLEGSGVADIAGALGMPIERVSDEKYKAVRKLRQHLLSEGLVD
jgi:RNA polymerase sigma factor (sigma-70 family)